MRESFDPFEFFSYLQRNWKFIAGCCAIAGLLAGLVSWITPNRYTATATILIDAPAGNDPRSATAVSPIYLESLRTYERFASSDSLFLRAVDRFKLREMLSANLESMKKQILKVAKPRDTKLLEIEITLTDATKAQAVAQFLAEETVRLNQSLTKQSDDEFLNAAQKKLEAARARYDAAMNLHPDDSDKAQVEALRGDLETLNETRGLLLSSSATAKADAEDYTAQSASLHGEDAERIGGQAAGARARLKSIEKELAAIDAEIARKQATLAKRQSSHERVQAEQAISKAGYDMATHHLDEAGTAVGVRGERLKIIDPGVVPERPSSPRTMLNILAALLAAWVVSILYLTVSFLQHMRTKSQDRALPAYR
jgi:uncharacterized protein involved in exopolysaccharide biosynthesis